MGDDELYFVDLKYVESNKEEKSTYYLEFTRESYDNLKPWKGGFAVYIR